MSLAPLSWVVQTVVLLCFIDPRVRKIRNEPSSCPGILSRTLRFYYVASSPVSPLPHLLDGCRSIPARSCPGPVRCHWGSTFITKLRSLCAYICIYVCMCVYMRVGVHVCVGGYIYIYICIRMYVYVCEYICACACEYVYM